VANGQVVDLDALDRFDGLVAHPVAAHLVGLERLLW
jgi:hypothetical protein